eukprot:12105301-Prorocentrum_lima.AAC.1
MASCEPAPDPDCMQIARPSRPHPHRMKRDYDHLLKLVLIGPSPFTIQRTPGCNDSESSVPHYRSAVLMMSRQIFTI